MFLLLDFLIYIVITLFIGSLLTPMPLTDSGGVRYRTLPWMTFLLITTNSLAFLIWQAPNLYQGSQLYEAGDSSGQYMIYDYVKQLWLYGYRADLMREGLSIGAFSTFTSMFMHGDMWHLLGNMIYLWAFGRRIEDSCGPWRYLLFYLFAGMVANFGSTALNPAMELPAIGASGAISGIMGAYLIMFPSGMVISFWGIGIAIRLPIVAVMKVIGVRRVADAPTWRWTIKLPAWFLLIYFLVENTLPSLQILQQSQNYGGVNTLAHVTGFLAALMIFLFVRKDLLTRYLAGRSL
ncbi:MAG TPA: rhomboid family intramembrane serine protease [Phototrophicaceae bacterium]|nr:rhomboid family intramembrane serine protease [Phototrophicaceae bacterium]